MQRKTKKSKKLITATIDFNAIRHNLFFLRKKSKSEVMVVLKANAYGLGMVEIAKFVRTLNVIYIGVATVGEAIELRQSGDTGKILAWIYDIRSDDVVNAIMYNIEIAIFDENHIPIISSLVPNNKIANIHLFVDTGINRNGIVYDNALDSAIQIYKNPKFKLVGIMSHLCCVFMKNKKYTNDQYNKFKQLCDKLEENNIYIEWKHISNSGGVLNYANDYNMVRCGEAIYGMIEHKHLLPVLSLTTKIIQLKQIKQGEGIGYDRKYIVKNTILVAIVPIGYVDIPFVNSKKICVYVNGTKRNVLALSMDQIVIESNTKDKLGDVVELFGKHQSIYDFVNDDISSIVTHLGNRVNKQYINKSMHKSI